MANEFIPPTFANLGKSYTDLWKKKFDYDNVVKVVNKTDFGLTLTTSGKLKKDSWSGSSKAEYTDKSYNAEGEVDTENNKVYGKVSSTKLVNVKGLKLSLGGGFDPSSKCKIQSKGLSAKGEVDYTKNNLAVTGAVTVGTENDNWAEAVQTAAVLGYDGLSVGGQIKLRPDKANTLDDTSAGAQYERQNFIAALSTESNGDKIGFSWFHKVRKDWQLGAELVSNDKDEKRPRTLSVASQYAIDANTTFKTRWNNFGEIGAVVEHRLANPTAQVGAAAQFSTEGLKGIKTDKFGLSLTLGDF